MPVDLSDAVRAARIEGRRLGLRHLHHFAEHLRTRRLVEAYGAAAVADRLERAGHPKRGELAGQDRLAPRRRDERLRGEVVELVGLHVVDDCRHRRLIEQITRDDLHVADDVLDAFVHLGARAAGHADDAIALFQQQFGEIGTILPRNARNQRGLLHVASTGRRARRAASVTATNAATSLGKVPRPKPAS